MSLDDFIISYFTAGSQIQTLSMSIFNGEKESQSEINALSTILFVSVLCLLIIINIRRPDRKKS